MLLEQNKRSKKTNEWFKSTYRNEQTSSHMICWRHEKRKSIPSGIPFPGDQIINEFFFVEWSIMDEKKDMPQELFHKNSH